MIHSHFVLLVLFAFFVSLVFALISNERVDQQLRLGAKMFAGFLAAALALGWLMYPWLR